MHDDPVVVSVNVDDSVKVDGEVSEVVHIVVKLVPCHD